MTSFYRGKKKTITQILGAKVFDGFVLLQRKYWQFWQGLGQGALVATNSDATENTMQILLLSPIIKGHHYHLAVLS